MKKHSTVLKKSIFQHVWQTFGIAHFIPHLPNQSSADHCSKNNPQKYHKEGQGFFPAIVFKTWKESISFYMCICLERERNASLLYANQGAKLFSKLYLLYIFYNFATVQHSAQKCIINSPILFF